MNTPLTAFFVFFSCVTFSFFFFFYVTDKTPPPNKRLRNLILTVTASIEDRFKAYFSNYIYYPLVSEGCTVENCYNPFLFHDFESAKRWHRTTLSKVIWGDLLRVFLSIRDGCSIMECSGIDFAPQLRERELLILEETFPWAAPGSSLAKSHFVLSLLCAFFYY